MDEMPTVNEVICQGPLHFVVDETTVQKNPATGKPNFDLGNPEVACVTDNEGHKCVAVFTDYDLAMSFAENLGKDFVPSAFPGPASFIWFLEKMQANGNTHVAVDPYKLGYRTLIVTIPEFIAGLRECRIDPA